MPHEEIDFKAGEGDSQPASKGYPLRKLVRCSCKGNGVHLE